MLADLLPLLAGIPLILGLLWLVVASIVTDCRADRVQDEEAALTEHQVDDIRRLIRGGDGEQV